MGMRDYKDMKDIVIPKEQEEMMNIICDAWDECRSLKSCKECPDRPKEYMRMMMCTSLKYTRKFIEAGYTKQSTADVAEVKRGEWIDLHDENVLYEQTYKCSACGEWFVIEAGTPKENGYKYCPNCGARMDGEE